MDENKPGFYVELFYYIPQYNLFITCSNNKKLNKAYMRIHNFKESSLVQDSFLLKKELGDEQFMGRTKSQMIMPECEKDFHCMTRIPKENKCQIECLLDYKLD